MKKKKIDFKWVLVILVIVSVLFNLVFILKSAYVNLRKDMYAQAYQQVVQGVYNQVKASGEVDIVFNNETLKLVLTEPINENEEEI
jgi:ABC-type thiamin/hydroxymethylpyrimidine transport system permease subunit